MRAWIVREKFGLESLVLVNQEHRPVGAREVRLAMRAVSLNYRDLLMVRGQYNPKQPLPLVPCSDGVGVVTEVGAAVRRVKVGDRVCPIFAQEWLFGDPSREALRSTLGGPLPGTLSEEMVLDENGVVVVPPHLDDSEAATLPCAALTAWCALTVHASVRAGDVIVAQGTGGVSMFALQLGRLMGAEVIVTSSSDEKLARAKALGATHGINYRTTPDWAKAVRDLTGGRGADLIVEVGGAGTLAQSLKAVRPGGTVAVIGILAGRTGELDLAPVFMQNIRMQGVFVGHRDAFEAMNRAIAAHRLRPVIDRVFGFEEAGAAFAHLAGGTHLGKVCVRVAGA
jgi:NADPH:quinone reductase-like Zn-dependent oxidoreductase